MRFRSAVSSASPACTARRHGIWRRSWRPRCARSPASLPRSSGWGGASRPATSPPPGEAVPELRAETEAARSDAGRAPLGEPRAARGRRGHGRRRVLAPADVEARRRHRRRPCREHPRRVSHLHGRVRDGRALAAPEHRGRRGECAHARRRSRSEAGRPRRRGERARGADLHGGVAPHSREQGQSDHRHGRARRPGGDARPTPHDRAAGAAGSGASCRPPRSSPIRSVTARVSRAATAGRWCPAR